MTQITEMQNNYSIYGISQSDNKGNTSGVKPDTKHVSICRGMTEETIRSDGSAAQGLFTRIFDTNNDKAFNIFEAKFFNKFSFALDSKQNEIRIHNTRTRTNITIKVDNYNQFVKELYTLDTESAKGKKLYEQIRDMLIISDNNEQADIVIDLRKNSLTIDGCNKGFLLHGLFSGYEQVTLKNCSASSINVPDVKDGKPFRLNLINCADLRGSNPKAIEIRVLEDNNPDINIDADSKAFIKVQNLGHSYR